ncbi:MAG TPA: PorP/SprF family type IX secretion system membrane protein [Chitinophagaceae bacterium]|nr:PorP/SprF family type IX secretion system membrane protein [Chitinophagaceae bacterium]
MKLHTIAQHTPKSRNLLVLLAALLLLLAGEGNAQMKMPATAYFQNQFLANPALAGLNQKHSLNGSYGRLWNDIPGAPETITFSGDFGFGGNMGGGLSVLHDKAGIIQRTRIMGSYAYHVPFTEAHNLHLGISAGAILQKFNRSGVIGDVNDPLLGSGNGADNRFEADFGAAYTYDKRLTIQATAFNLVSRFTNKDYLGEDHPSFYTAIGYKTKLNVEAGAEAIGIEPKLIVQGRPDLTPVVGAGANLTFLHELLQASAIYHSTRNFTFGVGINFRSRVSALVFYETRATDLKGANTGDSFDFGLRYSF